MLLSAAALVHESAAFAQDLSASDVPGDIIVTGTRSTTQTARESTSPIDVISAETLQRSGALKLSDALVVTNPSLTVNAIGSDTGALTSSVRLRGLNPNNTLVLLDGKRRHTTANVYPGRGPQQGSTPADLDLIPGAAIDRVEMLRDGAAALYGSDAIAGVINVLLKRDTSGLDASAQVGFNPFDGDGWQEQASLSAGFKLGSDGYIHLGQQIFHADHHVAKTVESRSDPILYPAYAGLGVPADGQKIASTPKHTRATASISLGKPVSDGAEFYSLLTFGYRRGESYQVYRAFDVARLPDGTPLYPNGFTPREESEEIDYAATFGLKGEDLAGFAWDISSVYGADVIDIRTTNTANTGLLATTGSTPTNVKTEGYTLSQWTNNLDLRREFDVGGLSSILALGAEYRHERYEIRPGEVASYILGGVQAHPGLLPSAAGVWSRDIMAGYVDFDIHPVPQLDIDVAARYETYSESDDVLSGKIASRYNFSDRFAIRGAYSTGFRAPTLPEQNYSSLNIAQTTARGLLPANSAAARSIGALPLKPERSKNVSLGIVAEPFDGLHLAIDAYRINLRDRIIASGNYAGQAALDAIRLAGNTIPAGVALSGVTAFYYANAADSRTDGLDITADYRVRTGTMGDITLSAAVGFNRTRLSNIRIDSNGNRLLNAQTIAYYETASPDTKVVLNAFWAVGKFEINLRETRYGKSRFLLTYQDLAPAALRNSTTQFVDFTNQPRYTTDAEIALRVSDRTQIVVGGQNLFNVYPNKVPLIANYFGSAPYVTASSGLGIAGGYYYTGIRLKL